ncbi:response regulator transcription factor [Ensifer canadensis]
MTRQTPLVSPLPNTDWNPDHLFDVAGKMSQGVAGPAFWEYVGSASAALGTEVFYDRLLDVLGALVETDLLALVRYSSFGAPNLVIPREVRAEVEQPYNSGLYELDPFYHYWQDVAEPSVATLHQLATDEMWESQYALEVLRAARISDELAVFLPPLGGASPTLLLDRAVGQFSDAELARVKSVFPLVAGLHLAHLKAITARGMGPNTEEKPLRIIDRSGRELTANVAWKRLAMEPGSGLAEAIATLSETGMKQTKLADGRVLVRSALAADFGAAPDGMCEEVEPALATALSVSPFRWLEPLTQRERQIVMLTLEGHPIASIAKRLGLQCGTVKNHRLRLYHKLDITTERELFLTHMRHMHEIAA